MKIRFIFGRSRSNFGLFIGEKNDKMNNYRSLKKIALAFLAII